jgi:hypothetical protein
VWHASIQGLRFSGLDRDQLRQLAFIHLEGVGDFRLGQWEEWSPTANVYHVRRRLSPAEQESVGPALDIRGTREADRRIRRVLPFLAHVPQIQEMILAESTATPRS